jgi:hypothetical protein
MSKENVYIKVKKIAGYDRDGLTTLKLVYHPGEHTVSAWVNDEPFLEDMAVPSEPSQMVPAYAGFSGFDQQANVKAAASFRVKVSP